MQRRLTELRPDARFLGFSVQTMARRPNAQEVIVGVTTDPVFGPVILFGQGGIAVEAMDDNSTALPPLNMVLARDLISRTRIARLLAGFRNRPPADMDTICRTLIQVSQLVTDIPEIRELDINPLLADENGVIALDARIGIAPVIDVAADRLAIRPYPQELESRITWQEQPLLIRPIRPEDGPEHMTFFRALDAEDVRFRMFSQMRELQPSQLARMTQIDYDREMAFIAVKKKDGGGRETLGVVRAIADPDNVSAEFAITVRSDLKGHGLGQILMKKLIDYCRSRGTQQLVGQCLSENARMLKLVRTLGFTVDRSPESGVMSFSLDLASDRGSSHPEMENT
jgi:acetyltransferase